MSPEDASDADYLVRRALALNREPGFNFPGHFLQIAYQRVAKSRAAASLETGPHCADADGQMNIGALALLADMALAATLRSDVGPSARLATVSMSLQFTGTPRTGRLTADATLDGFIRNGTERQGLARVEVRSGRKLVCSGNGAFIVLGGPDATPPHPLPRRRRLGGPALMPEDMTDRERAVHRHARKALQPGDRSFIERFWGYLPKATPRGATCKAWNGPHMGNRVGHAQGGVSFGLAAATASAIFPPNWSLVGASAWYIGPGIGKSLAARAEILHRGILTAVVRTRIADENARGVLELVTSHARRD